MCIFFFRLHRVLFYRPSAGLTLTGGAETGGELWVSQARLQGPGSWLPAREGVFQLQVSSSPLIKFPARRNTVGLVDTTPRFTTLKLPVFLAGWAMAREGGGRWKGGGALGRGPRAGALPAAARGMGTGSGLESLAPRRMSLRDGGKESPKDPVCEIHHFSALALPGAGG